MTECNRCGRASDQLTLRPGPDDEWLCRQCIEIINARDRSRHVDQLDLEEFGND